MQYVKYERFEPFMVKVQQERLFEPDSEETLLQAFKVVAPASSSAGSLQAAVCRCLCRCSTLTKVRAFGGAHALGRPLTRLLCFACHFTEKFIDENTMIEILTDNPYAFRVSLRPSRNVLACVASFRAGHRFVLSLQSLIIVEAQFVVVCLNAHALFHRTRSSSRLLTSPRTTRAATSFMR
jgi:hypothetical protein